MHISYKLFVFKFQAQYRIKWTRIKTLTCLVRQVRRKFIMSTSTQNISVMINSTLQKQYQRQLSPSKYSVDSSRTQVLYTQVPCAKSHHMYPHLLATHTFPSKAPPSAVQLIRLLLSSSFVRHHARHPSYTRNCLVTECIFDDRNVRNKPCILHKRFIIVYKDSLIIQQPPSKERLYRFYTVYWY